MEAFKCSLPQVFFGCGEFQNIGSYAADYGQKAFLVIDPYLAQAGFGERAIQLDETRVVAAARAYGHRLPREPLGPVERGRVRAVHSLRKRRRQSGFGGVRPFPHSTLRSRL